LSPKKRHSLPLGSIGFVGGGRMAGAIIKGLLSSRTVKASQICVSDIDPKQRQVLKDQFSVTVCNDNQKAASSKIVVLAVKPQAMSQALERLKIAKDQLLISIAAGINLQYFEKNFPGVPIIRVMPNNPVLVQAGVSAIALGQNAKKEDLDKALKIFRAVGEVVEVEERLMDAVTGLSGSGPAFIYLAVEAMIEAGETLGMNKGVAEKLAVQTLLGSAKTLSKTGKKASELREMVTSPGGTTLEGLKILEEKNYKEALFKAVQAAARRAKELSEEWT